jgi:hypothetical protein
MARKRRADPRVSAAAPLPVTVQAPARLQAGLIVLRHAVPLGLVLWFGGSVAQFLLLTLFNLAIGVATLGTIGVAVSTRPTREHTGLADSIAAWATLFAVGLGISVMLTGLFGWVLTLIASEDAQSLLGTGFLASAGAIVLAALPGAAQHYRDDLRAGLSEEQRKQRDQPQVFVHLLSAGLIFLLSGWTAEFGRAGMVAMALLVTAVFIARDLRPDVVAAIGRSGMR